MPDRFDEFRLLLREAINKGYETYTIQDFFKIIQNMGVIKEGKKYLILRHDIDTDIVTAKILWQIEQELHINGSFYFRLSTLDVPFMQKIAKAGGEASYHYEELATVTKKKGPSKNEIEKNLPYIREIFKKNLYCLRRKTDLPMKTVASHGDFVHRRLGIANTVILNNEDYRKEVDVELEVYDEKFMRFVTGRFSDTPYPIYWKPLHPLDAIRRSEPVVYLLIHPR